MIDEHSPDIQSADILHALENETDSLRILHLVAGHMALHPEWAPDPLCEPGLRGTAGALLRNRLRLAAAHCRMRYPRSDLPATAADMLLALETGEIVSD